MDSIRIPRRYFSPDPIEMWRKATSKEKRDTNCAAYLILLCGVCFVHGEPVRTKRLKNSLMQVYSVEFLKCSQEKLDEICGTMIVGRYDICYKIWQRDSVTPDDIDPKGFAMLTGPSVPIDVGYRNIRFLPRLFRKDETTDFYHPNMCLVFDKWGFLATDVEVPPLDEPGIDGMSLSHDRPTGNTYGKLLHAYVDTTCGRVKVNYALFRDAADSFLTVRLLAWYGGDTANVYGRIWTSDTLVCDDEAKSVAFNVNRDNPMSVKPGQYIPLHRPGTVVPMGQSLKVEVEIFHKNNMGLGKENDELVASGTCSFEARCLPEGLSLPVGKDDEDEEEDQSGDVKDEDDEEEEQEEEEDESTESDESSNEEDQSAEEAQFDGISKPMIVSGDWGTIELKVYWMPCWSRSYLAELDEEVSMRTIY